MNDFSRDIAIPPKASFPALALLAALWLPLAGPAAAADCPSGQIYRVSKKVCVDKAEAVKLGIIRPAPGKAAATAPAAEAAPEAVVEPEVGMDPAPASKPPVASKHVRAKKPDIQQSDPPMRDAVADAPSAPPPVATAPAAPSRPVIVRTVPVTSGPTPPALGGAMAPPAAGGGMAPSASPFGALNVENFAKP